METLEYDQRDTDLVASSIVAWAKAILFVRLSRWFLLSCSVGSVECFIRSFLCFRISPREKLARPSGRCYLIRAVASGPCMLASVGSSRSFSALAAVVCFSVRFRCLWFSRHGSIKSCSVPEDLGVFYSQSLVTPNGDGTIESVLGCEDKRFFFCAAAVQFRLQMKSRAGHAESVGIRFAPLAGFAARAEKIPGARVKNVGQWFLDLPSVAGATKQEELFSFFNVVSKDSRSFVVAANCPRC